MTFVPQVSVANSFSSYSSRSFARSCHICSILKLSSPSSKPRLHSTFSCNGDCTFICSTRFRSPIAHLQANFSSPRFQTSPLPSIAANLSRLYFQTSFSLSLFTQVAKAQRVRGNFSHQYWDAHPHLHRPRLLHQQGAARTYYIIPSTPRCSNRSYTTRTPNNSSLVHIIFPNHSEMAKKLPAPSSESSLSPVAESLIDQVESSVEVKPTATSRKRKATTETKVLKRTKTQTEQDVADAVAAPPKKQRAVKKVKANHAVDDVVGENGDGETKPAKKKAARTKKQDDQSPLELRTKNSPLIVGAHVSTAGGVQHSIPNIVHIGGNSFAIFLKSQRKWESVALTPEVANLFIAGCKEHGIDAAKCCLPHGSYLVNLAHPDPARKKQAFDSFLNDLERCNTLGIKLYNFHPGNANATTREEGIRLIAQNINEAHQDKASGDVVAVLETMASLGNTIGGTFADLAEIIKLVDDKARVGVCLDTCHVFAAGYDLRTPEAYAATMKEFDDVIGLKYLKALHMNDSKAPLSSYRDLHANIGTGFLGLSSFHNIVNDKRLHGLPMVLETPVDSVDENGKKTDDKGIWAREIKVLESLVGMDIESDEFKELETKLHVQGQSERDKVNDQVERKKIKDAKTTKPRAKKATTTTESKKAKPGKSKAKKKKAESDEDEDVDEGE
ncbi:hypothetical protein HBI24_237900 [Parastagonospora nodorum]|nr:hypothetical protein HBH68_217100 [Parastagonospora nodorum]KAH5342351.1 hypothetical protein HBI48_224680 [Parastagonospora nodorum]KAH5565852.1 hypothetical protein HBI24_237900 [Parastagonospora nodorum]